MGFFQLYSALFFGSFLVIIFLLLFFLGNRVFSIYLLLESFLWVVLTTWCCLVMHEDQRQKDMEQLINGIDGIIKANSGKSLHQETQQTNKTDKAWYLASVFLIGLVALAVFYIKGKHHSSNNPSIDAKNPSHKNYKKNDNNRSKPLNP
ncbi:flagellar biosynthesis protein FlgG [Helicobacter pylori]|uniref:flagellar biosynthesis protein FlgG n=2 Tax=Helicobacter pylori TaxID=210 RepID=UPI0013DE3F4D|nr:flagellar biosynthesis protein FlgG [Helicobacter pylori]